MFRCRKSLAVLMTLCFLFTLAVPGFASETGTENTGVSLEEARDGIVGYYLENKTELDSWREVVGLKEAGQDLSRAPWKLPDWQVDSLDKESDPTRYAGTILGMLAVGQDPTQVAVSDQVYRDLVAELAGMQQEDGSFGGWLNQTIWSIIALDEAGGNYSTEKAISFLLSQQKTDGGFALSGDTADPDTTGDALLALASHKDVAGVSDAIDKAIECLKKIQLPNGGFVSWGSETPESAAAVIRGLLACGEKDITSGDWQKEKGNMIDALFAFQLEDGSFVHSTSETKYNSMATEQALMAVADLVNAGINYTVETGKRHGGEQTEATVRVRVEGATESLADETVTVTGTALDALKAAVGEENLVANGDAVFSIYGECGTRIKKGLYSGWMYYVIRDGAVDLDAFNLSTGSYNVQDGDELVFYIAAYQTSFPYAVKTYLPDVQVTPTNPTAGQTVTVSIAAKKLNDMWDGLVPITPEEAAEVGDYKVLVGDQEYTSQFGQVTIQDVPEGTLNFTVTNYNEAGYPNVVTYKGSIDVQPLVSSTVRVRVEGARENLADETVTVTGTALDALKDAVGEENVDAPGGFINSILGEGGEKISDDISTSWMYYVIRDGAIDEGAFSQGAGSFNVQDGDEVVFYIGAMDSATWAAKTFFPQVEVTPETPKAGQDLTLTIKVLKYDWMTGLADLTPEELQEIGEFMVVVGNNEYQTKDGQVTIQDVPEGTLNFTVTNYNEAGYPNMVTYKGAIEVGSSGGSGGGGGSTNGEFVEIAVMGINGELLYGPSKVEIRKGSTHGCTPLGALDATRLKYTLAPGYSGFVNSIAGQANSGLSGWMFTVNDDSPMEAADKVILRDGDRVLWYYSKDINDPLPKWDDLLDKKGEQGSSSKKSPEQSLDTVKEKLKDFEAGKLSVSELIAVISDEIGKLKDAELTAEQKEQFAKAAQQVAQSLDLPDKAIRVLPGGGEIRVKIDREKIEDFADCLAKARELSAKLKELEIEDVGSLVKDSLVVELPADKTLDQAVTVILPVEAGQALIEKRLPLVIAGPEISCSIPSEAVETVLGAVEKAADIEISARKVSAGKVNIEGAVLVGEKAFELDISAVTAGGEKEKPESDFEKPVTFTISLAGVDTEKLDAKRLAVYRKNKAGSWEYVGGKLAADRQSFSFKTQTTSLYALMEFQRTFPDIDGHWGQDEIELMAMRLVAKGMGDGSFAPDQKITRAQFAALLVNALELPCKSPEKQSFKDVPASYWGYSSIETAFDAGLISGVGDGRFDPERGITREEIASLTARALKKCGAELELSGKAEELLEKFKDSGEVSAWARDDLAAVVSKEIITGRNGAMLSPKTGATRAEAVVVLKKLLQNLGRI